MIESLFFSYDNLGGQRFSVIYFMASTEKVHCNLLPHLIPADRGVNSLLSLILLLYVKSLDYQIPFYLLSNLIYMLSHRAEKCIYTYLKD